MVVVPVLLAPALLIAQTKAAGSPPPPLFHVASVDSAGYGSGTRHAPRPWVNAYRLRARNESRTPGMASGTPGSESRTRGMATRTHAALLDADGPASNTVLVNHYNAFFGNAGGDFSGTVDDQGLLFADPGLGGSCYPTAGAAIDAGIPDYLFNDIDGTTNDMGACGGPVP